MKIDFDTILTDGDDKPILLGAGADPEHASDPMSLKHVAMGALLSGQAGDSTTPHLAYRLYTLANLVNRGSEQELEASDIDLIKQRVEKVYGPWIVGRSWDALEGRTEPLSPDAARRTGEDSDLPPRPRVRP